MVCAVACAPELTSELESPIHNSQTNPEDIDPAFPLEIQEMIIYVLNPLDGEWPDTATLARCALVCRNWSQVVVKILYPRIQVFGRKNYKLLERTLKDNLSIGRRVHTLCIHDITPAERASLGALHTLPRMSHLQIKQLFIFGALIPLPVKIRGPTVTFPDRKSYPQHCHFILPFQNTLLADLPQFISLQHIHLYHIRMRSLDGLRKILGSLRSLNSAEFRDVWWGDADAEFRPLHNATSWQLSQFSLMNCTRNHAAPFFWAMPPESNQTQRRIHTGSRMCHPGICAADVVPLVRLADFVLGSESCFLELARSFCWEWERAENGTNECRDISFLSPWAILRFSHQGTLKCCIDKIQHDSHVLLKTEMTPSFLYFHFRPIPSLSGHKLDRIVEIRIFFELENKNAYDMIHMESILCEFQELRSLRLDNLDNAYHNNVHFDLTELQRNMLGHGVLTSEGPPIVLRNWRDVGVEDGGEEKSLGGIGPGIRRFKEANYDWVSPELCCDHIRHLIADSRSLVLSSLMRLMDKLLNRGLHKEAERGREGLLQVQRELALVNKVKYAPFVNKTLHSMFQVQTQMKNDSSLGHDGEAFYSMNVEHLWSSLTRTRVGSSHDNPSYTSHFLATLTGAASSHHKLGDRETAIDCWVRVVDVCAQLANGFDLDDSKGETIRYSGTRVTPKCIPWLADAIRNLALHSPQQLVPLTKQGNCQTRLWEAWAELARQDATDTPCLKQVLAYQLDYLFIYGDRLPRSFDVPDSKIPMFKIIPYQEATVDVWRGLAELYPMVYTPNLVKVLEEMVFGHRPREEDNAGKYGGYEDVRKDFIEHRHKMMGVWRWVVKQDIFTYAPSFGDALDLSASDCIQMQQHIEAIDFRREAVDVWRKLAQRDNTSYGPRLENSLYHLALGLPQPQNSRDEITPRYEAAALWRELTERNASAYLGHLMRSLYETGHCLHQLGHHDQAIAFCSEAVEAWRSHEKGDPATSEISYLQCLKTMSQCLGSLNRDTEAVPLICECVNGFRRLENREELYTCLDTQSIVLAKATKLQMAVTASQESVQGFRSLGDLDSQRYHPELAQALYNLSLHLCVLGQHDQALEVVEEALAIYRTLASDNPSKYDLNVAETPRGYAFILWQVGRFDEATKASDEASEIQKVLKPVISITEPSSVCQVHLMLHLSEIFHKPRDISHKCPRPKATCQPILDHNAIGE